jgi:hypothetical protein
VNVGQRNFHALVGGDVHPGDTSHYLPFFSSTGRHPPHLVAKKPVLTKKPTRARMRRRNRWIGMICK